MGQKTTHPRATCDLCGGEFAITVLSRHRDGINCKRARGIAVPSEYERHKARAEQRKKNGTTLPVEVIVEPPVKRRSDLSREVRVTSDLELILATVFPNGIATRDGNLPEVLHWVEQTRTFLKAR